MTMCCAFAPCLCRAMVRPSCLHAWPKGRRYLQQLGFLVAPYFRPSEEREATENSPFMSHRLAAIDVMIAADLLCAENPSITCPRMHSERELKRNALRVQVSSVAGGEVRDVAVIPD